MAEPGSGVGERPPWLVLLSPLPGGVVPRRRRLVAPADPAALNSPIAGWEDLVLELSAGPQGIRIVQVLVDAADAPLSGSDHVLVRDPGARPVRIRQESIGGRFEPDGTFHGTCWLVEGPEPEEEEPPDWTMTPRAPTDAEAAVLRTLLDEVRARAPARDG